MTMTSSLTLQAAPEIERIRHDLKRRELTVQSVERLTPAMLRITFEGDDLADFVSLGADDHVKLIIPVEGSEPQLREYTPRRYDNEARTLVIDFAVHDAGPATLWALSAKPGDTLTVGGPRGSAVISAAVTDWLLIGDETALPAIGRRIEEAVKGMRMTAILAVPSPADQQAFETDAELSVHWVYRGKPGTGPHGPSGSGHCARHIRLHRGRSRRCESNPPSPRRGTRPPARLDEGSGLLDARQGRCQRKVRLTA
jgi:NADPH-dependent ferric siderophore reductase